MKRLKYFRNQLIVFVLLLTFPVISWSGKFDEHAQFRKAKNHVYVIAHRGAHIGIPENSLAAYQKAIDLGCDFVEIDVRTTKDGKFVSVHNSSVDDYVKGTKGKVKDLTLDQLEALDIGSRVGPEWKNTRIPTFEQILQLCQGKIGIYLDLKDAPVPELMKLIKKYHMEQNVIWYISAQYLMRMKNEDTAFGNSFPMPDPGPEKNLENVLIKLKPAVVATDMGVLSKSFVEEAHKKNAKVFVDEDKGTEAEWNEILSWKTDGIQTNDPGKLIQFLKNK
ncbi:MAG TPA: glycerophosphodiester phosphodiesterase family protein [Draconibacterium sp.]|nr:glycerophosphodiester phosphodiesterase family protein [Draconibacterium sp.]